MRHALSVVVLVSLASFSIAFAQQSGTDLNSEKSKSADEHGAPAADHARANPVKPSPEGLAEARKVYGYDCAMCHGDKGDGKGDIVESMKLEMHDWHNPSTLAGKTDAELFDIITKGKGKMMGEGDRAAEKLRWNLVNLVRAIAAKGGAEQKGEANTAAPPGLRR